MENTWQQWRGVWSGQSGNEDDFLWKRLGGIKTFCSTHRISPGQDFSLVTLVTVCQLKIDVTSFPNAGDGQFQRHWPLISGIVLTMTKTMTMIGFRDSSDEQRCSLFVLKKGYTKIAPPVQVV